MKSSTRYFHMKRKILADFQTCISVPLNFVPVKEVLKIRCHIYILNEESDYPEENTRESLSLHHSPP